MLRGALGGLIAVAICALVAPAAFARTIVTSYTPFTASGELRPSLTGASVRSGSCYSTGINGRADSWRCISANFIYDPCFESPIDDFVLCPGFPGARDAVKLESPEFDRSHHSTRKTGSVWAVRVGRHRCVASSGARSIVRGRAPSYFCGRGRGPAVWGALDRRRRAWRALIGTYDRPSKWRWRNVQAAWR